MLVIVKINRNSLILLAHVMHFTRKMQSITVHMSFLLVMKCVRVRQAESDLAMLILSSINSTKAMESAYRNLGREYSQERFDVYSSFTSDLEKIVGVADFLIEKTGMQSNGPNFQPFQAIFVNLKYPKSFQTRKKITHDAFIGETSQKVLFKNASK